MFKGTEELEKWYHSFRKKDLEKIYEDIEAYFDNCKKYGLQRREGQVDMALSVFDAIESFDSLIIEAGVGIGKSFAYLIPLIYYYKYFRKSFIISTSTIALQEQLEADIKNISEQLNIPLEVVVAKGMSNFLCLNRLETFLENNKDEEYDEFFDIDKQDRRDYPSIKDNIWKNISVDGCIYSRCDNCKKCEFYKRRNLMKNIRGIIICNHDLLIEDLSRNPFYGNKLFKDVEFIVCDEAHNLESKIRNAKTKEVKLMQVKNIVKQAIILLEKSGNYEYKYHNIKSKIDELSNHINKNVLNKIKELKLAGIDIDDCNGLEFKFDEVTTSLSNELLTILNDINDKIQMFSKRDTDEIEEELYDCSAMFEIISERENSNYLFWIERRGKRNYIYYAPKNISEIAYNMFFGDNISSLELFSNKTFIFTSATLSVGKNDFSYFMNSLGVNENTPRLTLENSYESPYNYDENTLLYCCSELANPKDRVNYLEQLTEKIKELIKITNGKALVLFTSKSDMQYVYHKIGNKLNDINIFIQNDGSSQDKVKNDFKNDINSVLFSTGIFWEGIDIKGESLSNLIIARLPFPVVDPVIEYKKSLYNKNGFKKVYIPEMLIKLKQGVGRLIRSETDKGIVCILDSRLPKYETVIKETIPIKNFVYSIDEVKKFVEKNNIN